DTLAQSTHVAEERIANIRTVRSFSREFKEITTYNASVNHVLQMTYKESLARAIFFGMYTSEFRDCDMRVLKWKKNTLFSILAHWS
ncbi:hypothetical protein SK128_018226, partial [Halocaridina rubra]